MPKAEPHFDAGGLCEEVLEQDIGLIVSTNNVASFRRILYVHFKKHPEHTLRIYSMPTSPNLLFLLKQPLESYRDGEVES